MYNYIIATLSVLIAYLCMELYFADTKVDTLLEREKTRLEAQKRELKKVENFDKNTTKRIDDAVKKIDDIYISANRVVDGAYSL